MNTFLPYTYKSIINNNEIKYDGMKVMHQLKISESLEENTDNFLNIIKNIILDCINVSEKELFYSDFEYLIYLIRAKTYGEIINFYLKDKEYNFNINEEIKIIGNKGISEKIVNLSNGDNILISPLNVYEFYSLKSKPNTIKRKYEIIINSIRKKVFENSVEVFNNIDEKQNYILSLSYNDCEKLVDEYNNFAKIIVSKVINEDGIEKEINIGDVTTNFFVL